MTTVTLVALITTAAVGGLMMVVGPASGAAQPAWNGLTVNPQRRIAKHPFDETPRKQQDAVAAGFELKDVQCSPGSKFRGVRLWRHKDPAFTLIYDKRGQIAGVQSSASKQDIILTNPKYYQSETRQDVEYWTQTVYFVHPSKICENTRSPTEFEKQGTGTGLWIQIGDDPLKDLMAISQQAGGGVAAGKEWDVKAGTCSASEKGLGRHVWHKTTSAKDKTCDSFVPYCLLYNADKLVGFCMAKYSATTPSRPRLPSAYYNEPLSGQTIGSIMNPVPECLKKEGHILSTTYVYLLDRPELTTVKC